MIRLLGRAVLRREVRSIYKLVRCRGFQVRGRAIRGHSFFPVARKGILRFLFQLRYRTFRMVDRRFLGVVSLIRFPHRRRGLFGNGVTMMIRIAQSVSSSTLRTLKIFLNVRSRGSNASFTKLSRVGRRLSNYQLPYSIQPSRPGPFTLLRYRISVIRDRALAMSFNRAFRFSYFRYGPSSRRFGVCPLCIFSTRICDGDVVFLP